SLIANIQRAVMQGTISGSVFVTLMIACVVLLVGVGLCVAEACMSMGNRRMRFNGLRFSFVGSLVMVGGLVWMYLLAVQIANANVSTAPACLSGGFFYYLVIALVILLTTVAMFAQAKRSAEPLEDKAEMKEKYKLFLMFLPVLVLTFVFAYLPLWGWRYAFFDYKSGGTLSADNFVGLKWFTILFQNDTTRADFLRVLANTLGISFLSIITSWIPMIFAVFLTQAPSKRFRRVVQTFTTVPNFLGWVIVYAVALAIFSSDGFINNFLNNILGMSVSTNYLMNGDHMWIKMLLWGLWKGVGWSAIIYIAAITGIDPSLYEAAEVDGAGRFQKMWYVTIPCLLPTFFVLLLLSIGNILSNGLDQYLVFSNAINSKSIEVLDLYVYNLGIGSGQIPMSTAVGMFKSVISVALLLGANTVSKKIRGESII
ncbi:MAG: ABC transporter permease subunit, partial [Atopobiaceae bacterium]|nr:ABC transporter permease subunit [Atopobiaceae bacterium]